MTTRVYPLTGRGQRVTLAVLMVGFLTLLHLLMSRVGAAAASQPSSQQPEQQPSEELITRVAGLLESASPPDRAWGAYLAHKNGLKQFVPNLIDGLRTLASDESEDGWLVTSAVIDSLIQLEADVPSDVIMSLKPRFTDHKVILLARSPLTNKDALLDLMRNSSGKVWRAAGNLLTEVRAPGLAALLLNRLQISVSIAVFDPGAGGAGGGSSGGYCGDGFLAVPKEYPPIGFYGLSEYPQRGYIVLAPGPRTIYHYRVVVDSGAQAGWGGCGTSFDYDEAIIEYLAALLKTTPAELPLKSTPSFSAEWKGAAALTRRIVQIKAQVYDQYRAVESRLVDSGLLTELEAGGLTPHIKLRLTDLRSDRSIPLPDVSR